MSLETTMDALGKQLKIGYPIGFAVHYHDGAGTSQVKAPVPPPLR